MSTFIIPVDSKQKKVLKPILEYLNLSFQEVESNKDFWQELSLQQQNDIEQGIKDADAKLLKSWKDVLKKYQ